MNDLVFKLIFKKIEELIKTIPAYAAVSRYKGEFEPGSEWDPAFPAVFISFAGYLPATKATDGKAINERLLFQLYVSDEDINEPDGLDAVETAKDFFNSKLIEIEKADTTKQQFRVVLNDAGIAPYGYVNGVEIFTLLIEVTA